MSPFRRTIGLWTVAGAALLVTFVIPALAAPIQGAPVAPLSGSAPEQWAYGGSYWHNSSVTTNNATFSTKAFFGWQVIFTATNTSSTTVMLEAQRTMGAYFYANACIPNCSSPRLHGNISLVAGETDVGFANVTTAATVYVNNSTTPALALGIDNASGRTAAHLNESMTWSFNNGTATHSFSAALSLSGDSHASVSFSPALGLVPWNATTNETWNSTSAFTAQGGYSVSFTAATTGTGHPVSFSRNDSASVTGSGTLSVYGKDLGSVTLNNGHTVPVIAILVAGPFDDVDGVILVPHDFDLFGGGAHAWDGSAVGGDAVATSGDDLALDGVHHRVKFEAAVTAYGAAASGLSAPPPPGLVMASGGTSSPAPPASPTSADAQVQAQPESVAQAQQASTCLANACGGSAGAHAGLGLPIVALVVGLVAAMTVGAVGVLEYRRRLKGRQGGIPPALLASAPVASAPPPPMEPPSPPTS